MQEPDAGPHLHSAASAPHHGSLGLITTPAPHSLHQQHQQQQQQKQQQQQQQQPPQSRTSAPTLPLGTGFTLASAYSAPLMTTGARLLQRAASASASRPASDAQPPP